jgi:hypothetical protein
MFHKRPAFRRCLLISKEVFCLTFSGLAKVAIFTTNVDAENQSSNLAKTVIRSTEPPLLPNPCYAFVVFLGLFFPFILSVVVRWLSSSFGFFCLVLCVGKNTNVLPKALAILFVSI